MSFRSCWNCFHQSFRSHLNCLSRLMSACSRIFRIHCLSSCAFPFPLSQLHSTSTFSYVLSPSLPTLLFPNDSPNYYLRMTDDNIHTLPIRCKLLRLHYACKRIRTSHIHHLSIHELPFLLSQLRNRCISSCAVFLLSPIRDFLYVNCPPCQGHF